MSPEAQRIAIAEACGWKRIRLGTQSKTDKEDRGWLSPKAGGDWRRGLHNPPDYLNDLNAMHEAEKAILTGNDWRTRLERYSNQLMTTMHATDFGRIDVAFNGDAVGRRYFTAHATAAQRCEAFLRTINKWDDSK